MNIRFYIPEGKVIPLTFWLMIDDKYKVLYKKLRQEPDWPVDYWGYEFYFSGYGVDFLHWDAEMDQKYNAMLDEIVRVMIQQSDGADPFDLRWREVKREVVLQPEGSGSFRGLTYRVYFTFDE